MRKTLLERFEDRYEPLTESGCWLWTWGLNGHGYGNIRYGGKVLSAHRVSHELFKGPIDGETVDHVCNVRSCVNPDHLRVLSRVDNIMRGNGACARHARQTHCVNGHPFSADNTYAQARGSRECRTCSKEYKRKWYLRKKEGTSGK